MRVRLLAVWACGVLVLGACGTNEEPALQGTPEAAPAVGFRVTPTGSDIEVEAFPSGFRVVDKLGEAPADGEGHIHFYLDVEEVPTTPGKPAVTSDADTYHATATTTHTWTDVPKGKHALAVQLVNNDHTPLDPPVFAEQDVTID